MSEVALFRLDRTITDYVVRHCLQDIVEIGLADEALAEDGSNLRMHEERDRFMGWLAGKSSVTLEPLIDITAQKTKERIASWAPVLMQAHVDNGRVLGIYSSTVPAELVEAYVEGFTSILPDAHFKFINGAELATSRGLYTGERVAPKWSGMMERLTATSNRLGFVADSFSNAHAFFDEARKHLLVNPEQELLGRYGYQTSDCLAWEYPELTEAYFRPSTHQANSKEGWYDLAFTDDKFAFLNATQHLYNS